MHIKVLRIVDILIRPSLNAIDHTRFEVEEDRTGDVSCVVGLVEEDIFAVAAGGRKVFEIPVLVDAVFKAELLPELGADCVVTLAWVVGLDEGGGTHRCCRTGRLGA